MVLFQVPPESFTDMQKGMCLTLRRKFSTGIRLKETVGWIQPTFLLNFAPSLCLLQYFTNGCCSCRSHETQHNLLVDQRGPLVPYFTSRKTGWIQPDVLRVSMTPFKLQCLQRGSILLVRLKSHEL